MEQKNKGFTLLELLLYMTIAAGMLASFSVFLSIVLQSRVKNQTIAEVEQGGIQAMQVITQTIRNAQGIVSPIQGGSSSTLSLDVIDATKNPTVFDILGGSIRTKESGSAAVPLTSSRISSSGLLFSNLSRASTSGTIRVQFTLSHINFLGRNEYEYSKTFYGSASVR